MRKMSNYSFKILHTELQQHLFVFISIRTNAFGSESQVCFDH